MQLTHALWQIDLHVSENKYKSSARPAMAMSGAFPTPRRSSAMFIYRHQLMLWGGLSQMFIGEGEERFMIDTDIPGNLYTPENRGIGTVMPCWKPCI